MKRERQGDATSPLPPLVKVELDPVIWNALQDIVTQQGRSVHELILDIAHDSLRVAIHIYIAEFYRSDITQIEPSDRKNC